MKKIISIIIAFITVILATTQVKALSAGRHYVTLVGSSSPFDISADGEEIFCNQHGGKLNDGTYKFTSTGGWTSQNDAMAYILATYKEEGIYSHDTVQRVIWNINKIDQDINWQLGTNEWKSQDWYEKVNSMTAKVMTRTDEAAVADAKAYVKLHKEIEENGYKCNVEQITSKPVAVETDEKTYIVGKFQIDYYNLKTSGGHLIAGLTDVEVYDADTGRKLDNVMLQNDKDASIYKKGEFPAPLTPFNVIIPYNERNEVKNIKIVAKYRYLKDCWAEIKTWKLTKTEEYEDTTYTSSGWQKQMSIEDWDKEWEEGSSELQTQMTPWTFELQKVGQQDGRALSNVEFEITFYDKSGNIKKDTKTYKTDYQGRISITGLDFYGDLRIKVKEVSTVNGYALDSREKWIDFHKDNGPTNPFTNIYADPDEITEINGQDGTKLTALIENIKEGFNLDIIKVDTSSNDNELSGAKFDISLEKVSGKRSEIVYKATGQKSPVVSISERDIREYLAKNKPSYQYDMEGDYVAHIKETTVPSGYRTNLKNKEITVEFEVSKKFLPSRYEVIVSSIEIDGKEVTNTNQVECEDVSDSNVANLNVYVKNEGYTPPPSRKSYTLNLKKSAVDENADIKDASKYYNYEAIFDITLYRLNNGSKTQLATYTNKTTTGGKYNITGLTYTGDILVEIVEKDSKGAEIIGATTKYVRYNASKSGRYYYINDYYSADKDGNKIEDLEIWSDGINLVHSGTSKNIPELTMEILNIENPKIPLTIDISGKIWRDGTNKNSDSDDIFDGDELFNRVVEVSLYCIDDDKVIASMITTNGEYSFTNLNAMKKYKVGFTYNGQDYENVQYFKNTSHADAVAEYEKDSQNAEWAKYSKASEDAEHVNSSDDKYRQNVNNRFGNIESYPASYTSKTGTSNTAYPENDINEIVGTANIYAEISNIINTKSVTSWDDIKREVKTVYGSRADGAYYSDYIDSQLQYLEDCKVTAWTDAYPALSKYTVSTEKGLISTGTSSKETFVAVYPGQDEINFGLKSRADANLELSEDVYDVTVKINDKETVSTYDQLSSYNKLETYSQDIEMADYNEEEHPELNIFVKYKIKLNNVTAGSFAEITRLINYYDARYYQYFDDAGNVIEGCGAYIGDDKKQQTGGTVNVVPVNGTGDAYPTMDTTGRYNQKYKAVYLQLEGVEGNKVLTNNDSEYVYITFKLSKDVNTSKALKEYFANTDGERLKNYTEIDAYKTWADDTKSAYAGLVDITSIPGNLLPEYMNEDDNSLAPEMIYQVVEPRTLSGNVFEDKRVKLSDPNAKINEKDIDKVKDQIDAIEGIQVELMEIKNGVETRAKVYNQATSEWEEAITWTLPDGSYNFIGYIPGDYVVKFTYGNKLYNNDSVSYSGQDYQSTYANPETNNAQYWYADFTGKEGESGFSYTEISHDDKTRINHSKTYSDAYDTVQSRDANIYYSNQQTLNNTPSDEIGLNYYKTTMLKDYEEILRQGGNTYTDKSGNNYDANMIETLKKANTMIAYTSTLDLPVAYAKTQREFGVDTTYNVTGIDFGLVKRADSTMKIEKTIKHITITQADGTILLNANVVLEDTMLGKRIALKDDGGNDINNDKVHFQSVPTPNAYGVNVAKLEIDDEILHGNTVDIQYEFKITNTTPNETTLTYYTDNSGKSVAIGYYEEPLEKIVYYEGNEIKYHDNIKVEGYTASRQEPVPVTTTVKNVLDYVSNNLRYLPEKNTTSNYWRMITDTEKEEFIEANNKNTLVDAAGIETSYDEYNLKLRATDPNPLLKELNKDGHTEAYVTLTAMTTEDVDLEYTNVVEILEIGNTAGRVDTASTVGNLDPVKDYQEPGNYPAGAEALATGGKQYEADSAKSEYVVITDATGDTHYYYVLIGSILAIFAVGIIGIKKFVLNKKK